jgi:hypothetical protein
MGIPTVTPVVFLMAKSSSSSSSAHHSPLLDIGLYKFSPSMAK